jgi:NTP pyrophosphatase (non-canonical NTP hydrolase)
MDFQNMMDRALAIRKLYEKKEEQRYGSAWSSEEIALGFVGDVGDLTKLILAESGKRIMDNSKEKLEHELGDCLWSLIVLAKAHHVDLEQSFMKTMDELENHLLRTGEE